jgi:hypothetical protein
MTYRLFVPKQAVGANLVYFDLFNAAGSCQRIQLLSVVPVVSGAVAVVGTVAVDLFLTRTTAVGTGGTAATRDGTALDACTFTGMDTDQPAHSLITARLTPAGGATAGAVISTRSVFTEETNSSTYVPAIDMVRPYVTDIFGVQIKEGSGIRVVQGAVASVGNIGFDLIFNVFPSI